MLTSSCRWKLKMNNDYKFQNTGPFEILKWNSPEDVTETDNEYCEIEKRDNEDSLLYVIFPTKEWTTQSDQHGPIKWRQTISTKKTTKADLRHMINTLNKFEQSYEIKHKGVCKIRSNMYSLFFDEIVRQVIIQDENLGKVLFRVRNELDYISFLWKCLIHQANIYLEGRAVLLPDYSELLVEVEKLTAVNRDLRANYIAAKNAYIETLDEHRSDLEARAEMRKNHRVQKYHTRRSTKQLMEQMNVMLRPSNSDETGSSKLR